MTEPSPARPVPGPPPTAPTPASSTGPASQPEPRPAAQSAEEPPADPFTGLDRLPVTEHVAVFETEHDRLRDELSTIDEL
jgi:hypothetical protein